LEETYFHVARKEMKETDDIGPNWPEIWDNSEELPLEALPDADPPTTPCFLEIVHGCPVDQNPQGR
jgi:hypothetical protein